MKPHLKIYTGEDDSAAEEEAKHTMHLGQIAQVIGDASRSERTWLSDFEDEEVQVSADLYELLTAYWQLRPGA
ncbi:MAG: hypothetical protein JKY95_19015 [Planctomycetaceae bacterium]|nr:hypothetical protein [Planctomycetaceae bacterium]